MMFSANDSAGLKESVISKSDEVGEWLNSNAYDFTFQLTKRTRLAVNYFYVALEHHKAIVLLISQDCCGSAYALVRPLVETYIKGAWITDCADETDLDYCIKKGKPKKGFVQLMKDIEHEDGQDTGGHSMIQRKAFSGMSDYVHTEKMQLSRHGKDDRIAPNFSDEETIRILIWVNFLGLLAGYTMNSASDSTNRLDKFYRKIAEYDDYSSDILNSLNSEA